MATYRRGYPTALLSVLLFAIGTHFPIQGQQSLKEAGAPPPGSGPVDLSGPLRVIEGDTFDVVINGQRVGIGLIGIDAPQGNTPCGQQAIEAAGILAKKGMHLEEALGFPFDNRKRRMYYAKTRSDGHSLQVDLVKEGYARPDTIVNPNAEFHGNEDKDLADADNDAKTNKKGCLWDPNGDKGGKNLARLAAKVSAQLTVSGTEEARAQTASSAPNEAQAAQQPLAAIVPGGFSVQTIVTGLTNPTGFTYLPDGRILISLKAGVVLVYKPGVGLLPTPFIDISSQVNAYWDHGLIGMAADPNFATNGFVYLLYTYEDNAANFNGTKTARLSRVTAVGDAASFSTAVTVLGTMVGSSCHNFPAGADCIPSDQPSHSIGQIKFASDGTMFVTTGDGASFNVVDDDALRSQDLDSLAGKLLHVTSTGAGISTNPFWNGTASANRSKVWSYGFRNPYRFNLRPGTGMPYVGQVGWSTWERLDVGVKGANQGWPCYEGAAQQPGYAPKPTCQTLYAQGTAKPPLYYYSHLDNTGAVVSTAVTAGTFYTGTTFPAQYQGAYFYGDYGQSVIRYLTVNSSDVMTGGPTDFITAADGPTQIQMSPDGTGLYYMAITAGELRSITYGTVQPPPTPPTGTTYVSDLTWTSMSNGWGPVERDMSNGEQAAGDGHTISIQGVTYAKGLGTNAVSDVQYYLGGTCSAFTSDTGLDDEILAAYRSSASVIFQVWADGAKLYDSGTVLFTTPKQTVNVNLTGKTTLELVVTTTGTGSADHADWAGARVSCGNVNPKPTATIASPLSTLTYKVGDVISYSGSATDGSGGSVPASGLAWSINIHHCPGGSCHVHPSVFTGTGASGSFTVPDHGDDSYFEIALTATNSFGQTDQKSVSIQPQTSQITLNSSPTGLQLVYGGTAVTAPYTRSSIVGSLQTITATTPQGSCVFGSWSDGGAAQHNITIGATAKTYTATYTGCGTGPVTKYASDVAWASATNGWGPVEKDMSNGEQAAGDGHPISIRSVTYAKGLGVHAVSNIVYNLATVGACTAFISDVGVDDEVQGAGSVIFQVSADGTKLFDSGIMTGTMAAKNVNVNITGATQLTLTVNDDGDGLAADHSDWAGARFVCNSSGPVISAVAASAITTTGATITWTTDKTSDSQVDYGTTTAYGSSTTLNTALVTSHSQAVTGLTANTLYHYRVKSKDSGGNLTTSGDFTFTTLASGPVISAVAASAITTTGATITWTTDKTSDSQVDYGTTTAYGSSTTLNTALVTSHSQAVTGLTANTLYHYRVKSKDSGGNLTTSGDFTFTTLGNTTGPVISAVAASGITTTGATITWTTDKTSDSQVDYGTTTAYGSSTTLNTALVTSHSQALAGLTPNTLYHYRVKSKDSGGNLSTSTDFTFTTLGGTTKYLSDLTWTSMTNGWGPVEKDTSNGENAAGDGHPISIRGVTYTKGLGAHAVSNVVYNLATAGSCTAFASDVGVDDETNGTGSVIFQVWVDGTKLFDSGIMTGTMAAKSVNVNITGNSQLTLMVNDDGDGLAADHADWAGARLACNPSGPAISAVAASGITTTGATITWTTDKTSDSQVDYGTSTAYGSSTTLNTTLVTSHSQALAGLTPNTLYHYRVKSKDSGGNLTTSVDFTFTTLANTTGPVISAVAASGITTTGATITWTTDKASDSQVDYGTTATYGSSTTLNTALVTAHSQALTGLTANTLYHYRVKSKDSGGNLTTSADFTFTTLGGTTKYLSDLTWTSMTNGWGPVEKDTSNGENAAGDGHPISIRVFTLTPRAWERTRFDVVYNLATAGSCTAFISDVGVDDETNGTGSLIFQVWADGTKLFDSGIMTGTTAAKSVNVNITGKSQLTLMVNDDGDGLAADHADWAGARLNCQARSQPLPLRSGLGNGLAVGHKRPDLSARLLLTLAVVVVAAMPSVVCGIRSITDKCDTIDAL